jgi:hypothetical protein
MEDDKNYQTELKRSKRTIRFLEVAVVAQAVAFLFSVWWQWR